jgi:[amino group carrier protein]-lysine/ornithine hydrolase
MNLQILPGKAGLNQRERERRVKLIEDVIAAYSPSGREEKVASLIHRELLSIGLKPRIDEAGNVICDTGSGENLLLLCGHMDTVPGELKVRRDGSLIYGRGATDAKGALLSLLFAFEDLSKRNLTQKVVFAGVTDEENHSAGLTRMINNGLRYPFAFFGEPGGISKITIGYKGHLTVRLEIQTPEVHASAPMLTANSAELGFNLYQNLKEDLGVSAKQKMGNVSVALTEINAGGAQNVIPGNTSMTMDVRLPWGYSSEKVRAVIRSLVEKFQRDNPDARFDLSFGEATEAYKAALGSIVVRAMSRAILRSGKKPSFIAKSGTGDMNQYAASFGSEVITYGPGDTKLSHTSGEFINIDEVFDCARILTGATEELIKISDLKTPKGQSG